MRDILRRAERGSVLFIILIAVALFAALGYAVSNMMQSGSSGLSINEEKARLEAGEILDYGRKIRQAVQGMRISNGCSDTDISFENPIVTGYENGTDTDCQVFDSDGGGMSWVSPANGVNDGSEWLITGLHPIHQTGGLPNQSELLLLLGGVNDNICDSINSILGHEGALEDSHGISTSKFTGTYVTGPFLGNVSPTITGTISGCFNHLPSSQNYFYQVLITR